MTDRRCEFCETPLIDRDPRARHCDAACRRAAGRAREVERIQQQALQVRAHGPETTGLTRGAARMRSRRMRGPIPSDMRISFTRAVVSCARVLSDVATLDDALAHEYAYAAMAGVLPRRFIQDRTDG